MPDMTSPIRKVFVGCTDIASLIQEFTHGFAAHGIECFSVVHQQSAIQGSKCDVNIENLTPRHDWFRDKAMGEQARAYVKQELTHYTWQRALKECDTFLFLWDSFRPDFQDLIELRNRGKRIVWWFLGEDARWRGAFDQEMQAIELSPLRYKYALTAEALTPKLLRLRWAEAVCDVIFNSPSQAGLALRPYFDALPYPMDVTRYPEGDTQKERPRIVHAPSARDKKGTSEILAVFEKLRDEGLDFDVEILEGIPHAEALSRYREADILIGQLYGVTLGKQDRELLAQGKVVVGGIRAEQYQQRWPADFPALPAELECTLRAIIPDVARRRAHAARGRAFISEYHNPARSCGRILDALQHAIEPDFKPRFFRDAFLPEPELIPLYNAATHLVSGTGWYKTNIASGPRAGLEF